MAAAAFVGGFVLRFHQTILYCQQIEAIVERDAYGNVVDWRGLRVASYDQAKQMLTYREPRRLVINQFTDDDADDVPDDEASTLIEFTTPDMQHWLNDMQIDDASSIEHATRTTAATTAAAISVVTTPAHELYVRCANEPSFRKISAAKLLESTRSCDSFQMLTVASNGVDCTVSEREQVLSFLLRNGLTELITIVFVCFRLL